MVVSCDQLQTTVDPNFTVQRTQPGPPIKPTLWNLKKCSRFWLVYKLPKPDSFVVNVTCDWLINVGCARLNSLHCNTQNPQGIVNSGQLKFGAFFWLEKKYIYAPFAENPSIVKPLRYEESDRVIWPFSTNFWHFCHVTALPRYPHIILVPCTYIIFNK